MVGSAVGAEQTKEPVCQRSATQLIQAHLQENQPPGVPPLELTGERTLPDVPEENYWFRRHLAVYEWIAARGRRARVVDLACGEGYGSDVLARHGRRGRRRRREPRGPRARAAALHAPQPALRARRWWRRTTSPATRSSSCRRSSTSRTRARSCAGSPRSPRWPTSRPRTGSRSLRRGRRSPTTRGTCASTRPPSTASCSSRTSPRSSSTASSTRASCACTSSRSRVGWDRVHPALRLTKPFYDRFVPAIAASDFALRRRPSATSTGRSTSSPSATA